MHRSFVVNLRRAVEVRPRLNGTAVLVMADGTEVPIARRQVVRAAAAAGGVIGRTPRDELRETTEHGGLYLRRLVRSQLGLSLLAAIAFGGLVGSLPLALYLLPGLQDVEWLGLPLPMLIVVFPLFPVFIAFGFVYERRAQALEEAFRDLVEPPE